MLHGFERKNKREKLIYPSKVIFVVIFSIYRKNYYFSLKIRRKIVFFLFNKSILLSLNSYVIILLINRWNLMLIDNE